MDYKAAAFQPGNCNLYVFSYLMLHFTASKNCCFLSHSVVSSDVAKQLPINMTKKQQKQQPASGVQFFFFKPAENSLVFAL